jgi:hypothetical protein
MAVSPVSGINPKHTFQPYGQKDTYAPPVTQATYALAAGFGLAAAAPSVTTPDAIGGLTAIPVPVSGNLTVSALSVTGVVREYAPGNFDGHFVAFQDPNGKADVAHFLADALGGKVPKVGR